MSKPANRRLLVGRRIVDFTHGRFPDGRGGVAHDSTIHLDNGARLRFVTEETDVGDYGVAVFYHPPEKENKP